MEKIIETAIADDNTRYEFVFETKPKAGASKNVYKSPKGDDYVIGFYKKPLTDEDLQRLRSITDAYRIRLLFQEGGDYWRELFCWPEKIVHWNGQTGILLPHFNQHFYFQMDNRLKGHEKIGKWFTSAKNLQRINPAERGDFLNYLKVSLKVAKAIHRLHMAGLAHSDLSYRNVLIDPSAGNACIIDIDTLVVEGKYPAEVFGTKDFIAPEVMCDKTHKTMPSRATDRHALAVLIYMYLLHRHPLRGGHFFGDDVDSEQEEFLQLGGQPLYIEHPTNHDNRNMRREYGIEYDRWLPWVDLDSFPAEKIAGPYLSPLFEKAFIDGLSNPAKRPDGGTWERAIVKTSDHLLKCSNPVCQWKYFYCDGSPEPVCPFCGTKVIGTFPVLHLSSAKKGSRADNYEIVVYDSLALYHWHVFKDLLPNEKIKKEDTSPRAYFQHYRGEWFFVNLQLPSAFEILPDGTKGQQIMPARNGAERGGFIKLKQGTRILLSTEEGGRIAEVELVGK